MNSMEKSTKTMNVIDIDRQKVVSLYIFDDIKGKNVIFITQSKDVFVFGSNYFGGCGLGVNSAIKSAQVLSELCGLDYHCFKNGFNFVLALTYDGQLATNYFSNKTYFHRPEVITFSNDINIAQISCGSAHTLLLTKEGYVYGWGSNKFGQIGCGKELGINISSPIKLENLENTEIVSVFCIYNRSFILTSSGLTYSWGSNNWCDLGHDSDRRKNVYKPKLIDLNSVIDLGASSVSTYFLTADGKVYFCGQYNGSDGRKLYKKLPNPLIVENIDSNVSIKSLQTCTAFQSRKAVATAIDGQTTYRIRRNKLIKTNDPSPCQFYLNQYLIYHTIISIQELTLLMPVLDKLIRYKNMRVENVLVHYFVQLNEESRFFQFSNIKEDLKQKISLFHVFDDEKGNNVLFITSADEVYGYGKNTYGCCGFGNNCIVNVPQIIPDLCSENIQNFYNGMDFVLARNQMGKIFAWGRNNWGQLGRGVTEHGLTDYLEPKTIDFFIDTNITLISCGGLHALALTCDGRVFGWGHNERGQVGSGQQSPRVTKPVLIKFEPDNGPISDIKCSFARSFALTLNGQVYSWGYNMYCEMGHDINIEEFIFRPRLISMNNIISICFSNENTYFLNSDGFIYFCGRSYSNDQEQYQKIPIILNDQIKFESTYSLTKFKDESSIASAISEQNVYQLDSDVMKRTSHPSYYEFYSIEYELTPSGLEFDSQIEPDGTSKNYSNGNILIVKREESIKSRVYQDEFEQLCQLGSGAFGNVYKVLKISDRKHYAIKIIISQDIDDQAFKSEIKTLAKTSGDYVVQYFDGWVENDQYFIQMELCWASLKTILKDKPKYFGRNESDPMNYTEYFISSQLLKEIVECVRYLHQSNPPIIHRDLKPHNILITKRGRNGRFINICDFGLATLHSSTSKSHSLGVGTSVYVAPEILISFTNKKRAEYNTQADIYSLGVIAQEIFECYIWLEENPIIKNNNLTEKWTQIEKVIEKMLETRFIRRPSCEVVLSNFVDWGLDRRQMVDLDCSGDFSNRSNGENNFFYTYFKEKFYKI